MQRRVVLAMLLLFLGGGTALLFANPDLDQMKQIVRKRFPGVAQISTADLAAWLHDPKRPKPILLDTRTEREFAISHLRGAIRVDPSIKSDALRAQLLPGRPVVTYCSVGYRSSAVAERLQKEGVAEVYNLEGSIFQWANENRPLEAKGQPATQVDPYNAKFGKMLDPNKRAKL